ncbi:hypothetical protein Acr_11g0003870 [Actinidia rufa]|uniref:Uncharacterized protein n=1 Tax=Actinidia rufa TaxID=165716 RepID=A0A7J0FBL7_9ERIC|nr:hypothetical protein Acr_11g0003870 [Actinidia rufa]
MTHLLVTAHYLEAADSLFDLDDKARIARRTMYVVRANLVKQFALIPVINRNDVNSVKNLAIEAGVCLEAEMDTLEANAREGREAFYKAGAHLPYMDCIPVVNQADLEAIVRLIEEFGWSGFPVYPLNLNAFQDALTLNQGNFGIHLAEGKLS